jgi:peptidoglycan/xylan/chitin deacetylase (PgdA/CDA1 family)
MTPYRFRSFIACSFALIAAAVACAAPLPLTNPGFEEGFRGWSELEGNTPMSRTDAASARTGKLGLRIEDNDLKIGSSLESNQLPAVAGKTYRLTFQARSFASVWGLGAYLRFRDASGQFVGEAKDKAVPPDAADWAPYSLEAVAPAGATAVIVWFHSFSTSTGAWDIDDLTLEEVDAAAAASAPVAAKSALDFSKLPPLPANPPVVVLKVDDLSTGGGNVPRNWKRITDFALERKIKLSIGVIAQSLGTANPSYINYIKDLQKSGLVEFWFHGWDHKSWEENGQKLQEFKGTSYEHQKASFVNSQALAQEKLGFVFTTFGSPFNGMDENTFKVFAEDPDMKVFLYANRSDQAKIPGKVILERVGGVNIEDPLFVPNADKFIAGYLKNAKGRSYYVIQGHPNQWNDERWAQFVKLVDYLQENHIPIVTPTEAAALAQLPQP